MSHLIDLSKDLIGEELDYPFLMHHLQLYSKPRDKISRYLKNGDLIRIKKGLYILGESYRKGFVSLEVLANLIYGPSYLSLEYALSYYGFIPERVDQLTSITTQKTKSFQTSLGVFSYKHLALSKYPEGIIQLTQDDKRYFLMASPEKAFADLLHFHPPLSDTKELLTFLCDNLRIEETRLKKLNVKLLNRLVKIYKSPSLLTLLKWIKN